jgi:hypothetical protein
MPHPLRLSIQVKRWIAAPRVSLLTAAATGLFASCVVSAQMVSPTMDQQPGPFSYFSKPTDVIGVMGAPSATEITPEGYLYTGFGELMFFVGPEQTPVSARIRTLEDGFLPVLSYAVSHLGIEYRFTMFAASVGENRQVVNFVRVTVTNSIGRPLTAFLTSAVRYQGEQTTATPAGETLRGDNRFRRPVVAARVGDFQQPGELFSPDWIYSRQGNAFMRDGRALYLFPEQPSPRLSMTLRSHYNRVEPLTPTKLAIAPVTPTGAAAYTVPLAAGESRTLDFRMPLLPVAAGTPEFTALEAASFDSAHAQVVDFWRRTLARGMQIELPEAKATDVFRTSLVYNLVALNLVDGEHVQTANQFNYHRFYLRDSADLVRMYDATGYADIGAQVIGFFPTRQQPDGNFMSQEGQYDGWGEALWAFGEHYRRTHDRAFAEHVFPMVVRAVDWLEKARAADPLHLMPKSEVRDNEYVYAHLTGYNFLALDGLQSAIELAQVTGHAAEAQRFQKQYADYHAVFFALLDKVTQATGGYIPPALEEDSTRPGWWGTDWGNLLSVTPEPVLAPRDPRVTATLKHVQARYQEGITTYTEPDDGQFLHHYLTIKNTLTELVREDQEQAIREFYAELLHTSSTNAGFEYAMRPWGSRDFEGNLAPHGWFAADYRNLLRNMMVREEGDTLHLLSAVSPEWIGAGKRIRVERAPSYFGSLDFSLEMPDESSAVLHVGSSFEQAPRVLVLHLPWFMDVSAVTADGQAMRVVDGAVVLPARVKEVRLSWHRRPQAAAMSYDKTVASYKAEYQKRYDHLLSTGEMSPATDSWKVPE